MAVGPGEGREGELRIALIGCGRRGTAAAVQALGTRGPTVLVAMADAFADRLEASRAFVERKRPGQVAVPPERRFVGLDAFERALEVDLDVALFATPPGFRPLHFERAVERGVHAFLEKPVAVDAPGVRRVLAAGERARHAGLRVCVGLQRHHEPRYVATIARLRAGDIGAIELVRCYWNGEGVWVRPRTPATGELEHQLRNWYYFAWLSGDHIVEQHVHNLDVANWIAGAHPIRAQGQGGRQVRTGEEFGEIYDHHAVEFTYANGMRLVSQCRQQPGTWQAIGEHAHGSLGTCDVGNGVIARRDGRGWSFDPPGARRAVEAAAGDDDAEGANPHQLELDDFFAAIRAGAPCDETQNGAIATMTAILGRMATYSGREITWEEAFASELALAPDVLSFDAAPPVLPDATGRYAIATPGLTRAL